MIDLTFFQNIEFLVPFLFTLAVVFGVLELASPIKNRATNVIIAVAIAFFAAVYTPFTTVLWTYLPDITWFFIIMFLIAFIIELFGLKKAASAADYMQTMAVQSVVLIILLTVGYSLIQTYSIEIPYIGGPQNLMLLVGLIVIIGIFWIAYKYGFEILKLQVAAKK